MITRLTIVLLGLFITVTNTFCQSQHATSTEKSAGESKAPPFIKQVTMLAEFKQAQKEVDSTKKSLGIPLEISVDIINDSFMKEDFGKNISIAYINQKSQYDSQILYIVKFDKVNQKIISVTKNEIRPDGTNHHVATDSIQNNN